jgi:TatD DNase family protein
MLPLLPYMYIDTHTHLYLPAFDTDRPEMMKRAQDAGVEHVVLPSIDSQSWPAMLAMEERYPDCSLMMGLHPCSVKEDCLQELALVEQWLSRRAFCAIGEIGLDFYWDTRFSDQQYEAFHKQAEWALQLGLPIVVHSRNAVDEAIDLVRPYALRGLKGVFHCFSGTVGQANQLVEMGFLLGIGGVVTYKNSGLAEVLEQVAPTSLVLETDAPYLSPIPHRGKRNESAYLHLIAEKLAQIYSVEVAEIARQTTDNARRLFSI